MRQCVANACLNRAVRLRSISRRLASGNYESLALIVTRHETLEVEIEASPANHRATARVPSVGYQDDLPRLTTGGKPLTLKTASQ